MRLIDADALLQEIESLTVHITGLRSGKGALAEFMREYKKSVLRIIDEQPTAFNQDKVIHKIHCYFIDRIDDAEQEEIEKLKHDNKVICGIIRNGGNTSTENINTSTQYIN